ncbi:MAG: RluA family pseudouridine synthase [Ruminococcus sp.]
MLSGQLTRLLTAERRLPPRTGAELCPAICNRLDRNTEGLVLAAKDAATLRELNRLIRENRIQKTYLCVLTATPPKQTDILHAYHWKDAKTNTVTISDHPKAGYREIITEYRVLQQQNGLCLAEITLHTGRTHQIRAHMAHVHAPLAGDSKYGDRRKTNPCTSNINCFVPISCNSIRKRIPALPT